ncbi:MAG: hypothetical protein J6B93_02655 [Clostridia bacterium]|nr:hypothetical protein [Clostridia bacterium]
MKKYSCKKLTAVALSAILLLVSLFTGGLLAGAADYMTVTQMWQMANTDAIQENVKGNFLCSDMNYSSVKTQGVVSSDPAMDNAISSRFAVKISSPADEGYMLRVNNVVQGNPYLHIKEMWVPADGAQVVMIQVKLPTESEAGKGSRIRINFNDGNGALLLNANTKCYTLEKTASVWSEFAHSGTIDNTLEMALPSGFEGYLAFSLPSGFTGSVVQIYLRLGTLGPSYGDFLFGGIYCTTDFNKAIKAKNAEMTTAVRLTTPEYMTVTENWYISHQDTIADADKGNFAVGDKGWSSVVSQPTVSVADALNNAISSKFSVKVSTPTDTGYNLNVGGVVQGNPYLSLANQWVPAAGAEAVMLQVKLPVEAASGAGTGLRISMYGSTNGLVLEQGKKYWLLAKDANAWTEHTMSYVEWGLAFLTLPSGFEGYIAFETTDAYKNSTDGSIESVEIRLGNVGPSYGDFYYGGIYCTTDFCKALKAQTTTGTTTRPVSLVDTLPTGWLTLTDDGSFSGNSPAAGSAVNATDFAISDLGWASQAPQATATNADKLECSVSSKYSVKLSAPRNEGIRVTGTPSTPSLAHNNVWADATGAEAVIIQVKMPREHAAGAGSVLRVQINGFYNNASYEWFCIQANTKYWTLGVDDSAWTAHTISSYDYAGFLTLPSGFEGYIAFELPATMQGASTASIYAASLAPGAIGPDYGDFYYGGIYCAKQFNKAVKGKTAAMAEAVPMTLEAPIDGPAWESGEWNSLQITKPFKRAKDANEPVASTLALLDKGWGAPSKATMSYTDILDNTVAAKTAIKLSSDIEEGYAAQTTFPYIKFNTPIDMTECKYLLLQLKTPELTDSTAASQFRFVELNYTLNGVDGGTGGDWSGATYYYLTKKGNEWVDGTMGGYGTVTLPTGFEGYVLIDLSTIVGNGQVNNFTVRNFEIRPGAFGAGYGDFVLGGVYGVYEFKESLLGKVLGADAEYMTSYRENDVQKMDAVRYNITAIGDTVEFTDLAYAEKARELYNTLVPVDQEKIEDSYMNKLADAEAKLAKYKPTFLGFKAKGDSTAAALKAGATLNINIPEGYTVADYGIIYIKSTMLKDSPLVLDDVRITKVATPVTVQSGDVEANAVIDMTAVDQYDDQYVFRAYVVYKNTADGSTVTTYNSGIVSGETLSDTASVALIDVTNAAGISVYAK